jgi:hypothetical protein
MVPPNHEPLRDRSMSASADSCWPRRPPRTAPASDRLISLGLSHSQHLAVHQLERDTGPGHGR